MTVRKFVHKLISNFTLTFSEKVLRFEGEDKGTEITILLQLFIFGSIRFYQINLKHCLLTLNFLNQKRLGEITRTAYSLTKVLSLIPALDI